MKGLRTQESDKFNVFWDLVQREAKKQGMFFFADCGEGHDFETDDMEGEDFCGWLVPVDKIKEFEAEWEQHNVSDEWIDNMVWAEWENTDGVISVEFNNYD